MSTSAGAFSSVMSGSNLDMVEIFQLLESSDLSVQEETVSLVKDNLGSVSEPWLLQGLVDYYMQSGNTLARDLLCVVRQQQHKALMNKIDEYLQKVGTRLKALTLLGHIVRSEPIWTHCIVNTKSFQTVMKCLQVDTDLPTITSALYVLVTLLPKVASQVSASLTTLCAIFVRLVSWNSIKPAGASEVNLMHLHTAVYALFLCLYGMYPCYFLKYLQQSFQTLSGSSTKGLSVVEREKSRVFENSILPMFDQVRLHPRLITESSEVEMSSEKWRKLESQDIIADISKVTLDNTENAGNKSTEMACEKDGECKEPPTTLQLKPIQRHLSGDNLPQQDCIWSPSVAIGLSTPPPSRGISPTPFLREHEQTPENSASQEPVSAKQNNRPVSLGVSATDQYVPHRPHQTSSSTSTPLKQNLPSLSSKPPQSPLHVSPKPPRAHVKSDSKDYVVISSDPSTLTDVFAKNALPSKTESGEVSPMSRKSSEGSNQDKSEQANVTLITTPENKLKGDIITEFTPALQPSKDEQEVKISGESQHEDVLTSSGEDSFTSAEKILHLVPGGKYIEKSPNELLDLHVQLLAESRAKNSRNRDLEWQNLDTKGGHETAHLRNQVLQMHCAMLYERHRREQHSIRARKLMRKVYDTAALETKNRTLIVQVQNLEKESENFSFVEKTYRAKIRALEDDHKSELASVYKQLEEERLKNRKLEAINTDLSSDKEILTKECEDMRTETTRLRSRVFTLEQLAGMSDDDKQELDELQAKVAQMKEDLIQARQANQHLQHKVNETRGGATAQAFEAKMLSEAYTRELEAVKTDHRRDKAQLDLVQCKALEFEGELQKKEVLLSEQKKYLENVKSLARGQIKAMEAKYGAQKQISQRLEIQVLELFSRLTAIEGEMAIREKTQLASGPRSIQSLSAIKADSQHQHILSSSPQLSPPIRSGVLSDSALWQKSKASGTQPLDGDDKN